MFRSALVKLALVLLAAFALLSLVGGRDAVSVLSGTVSSAHGALLGLSYALAFFAALLLAPPLLVTGLYRRYSGSQKPPSPPTH